MQEHDFQLSLSQLNIQNFATFKDQSINFNDQFNAIIGETGSGKSLILDAIQLILGHRATKKLIRKGFEFAIVEAVFSCNKTNLKPYFNDIGFPFEDEIVIKRVLYKNGKTKSFLNMQSCSLGTLIDFSRKFIDLVGQFENQKLLSDDYQRQLLDNFSQAKPLLTKYQSSYIKLNATQKELADLKQIEADHSQKMDYLSFQINEIETLSPSVDHELELLEKKKAFQSKEENKKTIAKINSYFEGSSTTRGLNEQLGAVANLISSPLVTSDDISSFLNAKEIINDLSYKINSSFNDDLDEQELDTVLDELDEYQKLKRKFNVSTTELVAKYHAFLVERDQISNVSESIELLKTKEAMLREDAFQIAQKLHELRVKQSIKLSTKLTAEIQKLKMNRAKVVIEVSKQDFLTINGFSSIAFTVQTNPGENFYKI
ncbi:MAG: AAA family ATPase, partial [Halobacteriovoraceae bacterium]|nr:AAA family ATPase [Halobacteriovoraceae bacterium]